MIGNISDAATDLVNGWAPHQGRASEAGFLSRVSDSLQSESTEADLVLLLHLYPGDSRLERSVQVARLARRQGAKAAIGVVARSNHVAAVVSAWLATPTWAESRRYFETHRDLIQSAEGRALLERGPDPVLAQHLAMLHLLDLKLADPFAVAADPERAKHAASDALRTGRPEQLRSLLLTSTALRDDHVAGPFALAGALLAEGYPDEATEAASLVLSACEPARLTAAAARFRRLAEQRSDLAAGALRIAELLDGGTVN